MQDCVPCFTASTAADGIYKMNANGECPPFRLLMTLQKLVKNTLLKFKQKQGKFKNGPKYREWKL